MFRNFRGFGQTVPATCQDKAQAVSQAQAKVAQASGLVSVDGGASLAQANQEVAQASQALQACVANPPTSTAQDIGAGLSVVGQLSGPLANLVVGILNSKKNPVIQPVYQQPGMVLPAPVAQSNNTIIIGVVAVLALLVIVMVMKK